MSRDEMSALQGKRLNKLVNLVYHNVPFYRNKMQEMDLSPDDIQTIEDIVKLPFTTKQDLRDNYPYGLQALWGGESGGDCYPGFYRKYGKACPSDSRLGYNGDCLYSFIRSLSGRSGGTYGIDQE